MSIISNTLIGVGTVVAATGYVFQDELLPPPPRSSYTVICDMIQMFDEFTTPRPDGCRLDGIPVRVILPQLNPY